MDMDHPCPWTTSTWTMDAAVPTLRHLTYLRCQDNESLFALLLFLRELLILEMVHAHLESASASNLQPMEG